jgi:predicted peroxiredoxin
MPLKSYSEEDCKVFVVLTTPDIQTQLMALVLTTQMSKRGELEQILFCGPAGELAIKGSKDVLLKPINKSPQMLLNSLIENGVRAQVCPLFLPNKGLTADALIDGVSEAKPPLVAQRLLEHGVKLFTF